ncbi:gamma-mobile-trio integrase GmtZ [Oceanospirillum sanctuarii]|uniref:gamma-mobile-trio integrase GmtZ n=1 Tax=Oceanospirillum sanctuarii TaxID=1434821 RepID=UPI000A3B055A|nr:VPA1269 family protein [Oceanospirillum sanctuarii]
MKTKYATLAEASAAARALGFKTHAEYLHGYKQDPKLPVSPQTYYAEDWESWFDFLGTEKPSEKYATLAEASAAARALGFKTLPEYLRGYKQDPKLPVSPKKYYAEDWESWFDFLGTEKPEEKYATLAEASAAARALGFKTGAEYLRGYKQDPKLPANPKRVYKEDWESWFDFLGTERPGEKYATLAEASAAAKALGFKTQAEYQRGYKQDPKLPANPERVYKEDWESWFDFLGTEKKYATLAEASAAAQLLGFKSQAGYLRGYKQDPKLPANPERVYKEDWESWFDFLGTERPGEKYATLAEASVAAQLLGFKSQPEYYQGYKQDPKLPANPERVYKEDWESWPRFLGTEKYATLTEASAAAKALGFKTQAEYLHDYKQDPKLAGCPSEYYAEDWEGWSHFLGTVDESQTAYPQIWKAIERYIEEGTNQSSKTMHLKAFLRDFVAKQQLIDDPGALLSRDIPFLEQAYIDFVHATGDTVKKARYNICVDFYDWVQENYCSDEDEDGELVALPGFRNPLRTVLKGFLDQLPSARRSESNKPVLPMSAILRAKQHLIPPDATSFRDLYSLHPFLEDCWFEIDPSLIDKNDPNCIYRSREKDRKPKGGERFKEWVYELWSPVKLVANYVLLSMPLRGQQICWLDSGEGDDSIPVFREGKIRWIKNTSHLATRKRNQGFIRQGSDDGDLSSYITTNKTSHKEGGYHIPYLPDDLAYWIIQLRDWQAKYNPLKELTPWTQIKLRFRQNTNVLKQRGKQAFLFRDPASLACEDKVSPMFTVTAFSRTLPAILFHSQQPGEDLAEMKPKKNSVDYESQFTPHSLRVSLITAYIVDGRAPIAVISKLVGHSSLVMTLYYTKVGHTHMRKELAAAEKRSLEQSLDRYQDLIIQKKIDEARPELIATDRNAMDQYLSSDWPAAAFQVMSIGICPMAGNKCEEGGEILLDRKAEALYSPVARGYLGARNCPRCRFFITGPAFLGGLSAISNEIILEINTTRKEYHDLHSEKEKLNDMRSLAQDAGKVFEQERRREKVLSAFEEKAKKLDMLLCDLQYFYQLITQSTELLSKTESDKHQLIVSDNYVEMTMHLAEQQSDFRLLAEVCANAEIYESASASRARPLLSQVLDKLADTNGIAPAMFRLTEDQQLKAANQVVQLIMQVTQNDWHVADRLVNGQILLEDLAEPLKLGEIRHEIESVMHGSLKFPIGVENDNE